MEAKIGRFTAVDPIGAVNPWTSGTNEGLLLNPQRLNMYAYGLNNPYRYVDPDGKVVQLVVPVLITLGFIELGELIQPQTLGSPHRDSFIDQYFTDLLLMPLGIEKVGVNTAFQAAKEGGKHAGFLKNYVQRTAKEIQRAIKSLELRTEEHLQKIANPGKHAEGWSRMSIERQHDMIKYWQKEAATYKEQAEVLRGLLK